MFLLFLSHLHLLTHQGEESDKKKTSLIVTMFSEKQKDAILDCLVKNHPDWLKEIQNTLDQKELLHEEKKSKQDFVKKLPVGQRSLYDLIHCAKIEIDDYVLYRCSAHSDSAGWDNEQSEGYFRWRVQRSDCSEMSFRSNSSDI